MSIIPCSCSSGLRFFEVHDDKCAENNTDYFNSVTITCSPEIALENSRHDDSSLKSDLSSEILEIALNFIILSFANLVSIISSSYSSCFSFFEVVSMISSSSSEIVGSL